MSWCEKTSLLTVPGLMTPGQRIAAPWMEIARELTLSDPMPTVVTSAMGEVKL